MENVKQAKPEVGTIYADGDGQFYEAVKVTSKTVTLRPIAAHRAGPGSGGPYMYSTPLLPCPGEYTKARIDYEWIDEPFTRRFSGLTGSYVYAVTIDHNRGFAVPWGGEPIIRWSNFG